MNIPNHVGIIMDGNGRWARQRNLDRTIGHREGIKRIREIVKEAKNLGIKILTIFAFSTENWDRPKKEIRFLFLYLDRFLNTYKKELIKEDIRLNMIGRRDRIPKKIIEKIEKLEELTKNNKGFILNVALDYGGRWDILNGIKGVIKDLKERDLSLEDLDENYFRRYLSFGDLPDIDLLIRTSGEQRISNFAIWHLAYSELYFPKIYWPDFTGKELKKAIEEYSRRERRFGRIEE